MTPPEATPGSSLPGPITSLRRPEPLFTEIDSGLQPDMFDPNALKEVIVRGRGKPTQLSMTALLMLDAWKKAQDEGG